MNQKIKPTYVTFEQSQWLKDKGFDEYCNQYYSQALFEGTNKDWEGIFSKFTVFKRSDFHFNSKPQNNDLWFECSAPEQWLVVEWLRVNHGIWVYVTQKIDWGKTLDSIPTFVNNTWEFYIDKVNSFQRNGLTVHFENNFHNSPQEAYSAAFDYIKDNNLI
jgi:hypothetical protein